METLKRICRTCLNSSLKLRPLFDDMSVPRKIRAISAVIAYEGDNFPAWICSQCIDNINSAFDFRQTVINNDDILKKQAIEEALKGYEEECKRKKSIEPLACSSDDHHCGSLLNEGFTVIKEDFSEAITKVEVTTPEPSPLPFHENRTEYDEAFKNTKLEVSLSEKYKSALISKNCKSNSNVKANKNPFRDRNTWLLCDFCGKRVHPWGMKRHLLIHKEASVSCEICSKVLKNVVVLRIHMNKHKSPQKFCEFCGKGFKYHSNYVEHLNTHTENKKFNCTYCDKYFLKSSILAKHIRSHTGERPYPCEYCKKCFSSRNALNTHIRQHTNEKPFICGHCSMAFPQKVSLKTHIKSKHSEKVVF